jgi:hypothetical protein
MLVGENQPLFVDVELPLGTAAGTYRGEIVVTDGVGTAHVPLSVEVWNLDLPDMNVLTTHFRLQCDDIKHYHAGTWTCYGGATDCWMDYGPTARTIAKRYEELLHTHRIDPGQNIIASPEGDQCAAPTSWTDYDAAMQPYMDGSYFADGVPSGRLETPFSPGTDYGLGAACTSHEYTTVAAAWAAHLKQKGWFERAVVYAYDEPDSSVLPAIAADSARMQAADADWKAHIMDTTAPTTSSIGTLGPALGIFCAALAEYDHWDWGSEETYGRAEWPQLFAQGIKLWFYDSNNQGAPYPTLASNTLDGLEPTMMMWGSWYEGATGFLYYATTGWDAGDSWGPTVHFGKTGDGVLIYPGNHNGLNAPEGSPADVAIDGPIPSYRLKALRLGLQDYALFALAAQHGLTDLVRTQIATVYSQLGGCDDPSCPTPAGGFYWKTDEAALQAIRRTIAQAIIGP